MTRLRSRPSGPTADAARRALVAVAWIATGSLVACRERATPGPEPSPSGEWSDAVAVSTSVPGMAWIPPGTLVAGTPLGQVPRVPDAEPPGVPLELGGFHIDLYPHPNEPGALPTSNVTRDEAKALCEAQGKRLCSELELERACKGPENLAYPYGATYRATECGTGKKRGVLSPNGLHTGCASGFGVFDLLGGPWVWTSSEWGRGTEGLVAIRGGNDADGDVVGRCAYGRSESPTKKAPDVGVRCCKGAPNDAKVDLSVDRGPELRLLLDDEPLRAALEARVRKLGALSDASPPVDGASPVASRLVVERTWRWRPAGNESLAIGGGCSGRGDDKQCGVLVAREDGGALGPVAFVSSGRWQPTIARTGDPRALHVHGGDPNGAFRKRLSYEWGRMGLGGFERKKELRRGGKRIQLWEAE